MRDPRAYLCLFPDSFFGGRWVQLDGTVTVVSLPEAMEPLVEYYRGISGEHPDWDGYRAAMVRASERGLVQRPPSTSVSCKPQSTTITPFTGSAAGEAFGTSMTATRHPARDSEDQKHVPCTSVRFMARVR